MCGTRVPRHVPRAKLGRSLEQNGRNVRYKSAEGEAWATLRERTVDAEVIEHIGGAASTAELM